MRRLLVCLLGSLLLVLAGCNSGSKPISITIVSPTGAQVLDLGQSFTISVTVSNDKMAKGATFGMSGVGALSNQSSTGVTYNAPTTGAGGTATITIASASDTSKTATITVTVTPPPSISNTSSTLAGGTEGTSYSANVTTTGGAGSLTYSVMVGSLPPGLTLNSSTGAITGTPTGPNGTANFTIQVKDASTVSSQTSSKAFTVTVNLPPAPSISTTSLAPDTEGTSYSQTVAVTGGLAPLIYSISSGALPAGLSINSSTGAITGSATGPNGTGNFTVKVTDSSNPSQSATQALSILVNLPAPPHISTTTFPADVEGTAYDQPVQAAGYGTLSYSISAGALPAGLNINPNTGHINGTPTGPNGASNFTVKVTDGSNPAQSITQALSITINLPPAPVITTTSLQGVVEFANYSQTVQATGFGTLTYSISGGALPAGLNINSSTGAITGTPTGPNGTGNFTVKVTDSSNPTQSTTQALSIAVSLPPAPSIATTSLANATVGGMYNQSIAMTGGHGPFTWSISAGSLPPGFSVNTSTGAITSASVPNSVGISTFTVKVMDSSNPAQSATQTLSISIVTGPLMVTTASLPTGAVGDVYPTKSLGASGGVPPYTWSISSGALPTGLNPLSASGQISGTPTASGTFNFTAKVTDSSSATATGNFSITVNPALAITTTSLPNGNQGSAYASTNLAAMGGVTPYTWVITSGSLPTGMNALTSSGQISGTPTAAGTFNFTVQVADASGGTKTANLSILVNPPAPLTITTTSSSLPTGTVNVAYPNTQLNATGGIQPYTWTITSGSLPTGMNALSSSGQISGTPTATGTFNFTVKLTDSATPTANTNTANLSITVNPADPCASSGTGSESLLSGQYALVLKGFDNGAGTGEIQPEPVLVGGVLTFNGTNNNGQITGGTLDRNTNSSAGVSTQSVTSGTYRVDPTTHRACFDITTAAGTMHYRASLGNISSGVASLAHMIGFDPSGPFVAGEMKKQNPAAFGTGSSQVSGTYVFGVSALQNSASCNHGSCGGKFGAVGYFTLSGGDVTGGEVDINTNGQLNGGSTGTSFPSPIPVTGTGGIYSISSATGRGTLTFTPNVSGASPVDMVIYVVSASDVLALNSDDQTQNSLFAGEMFQQSGTPFSANPLSGSYVGYDSGLGSSNTGRTDIYLLGPMTPGNSSLPFTQQRNDGGTFTSGSVTASYSVDSKGRATISGSGNHNPIAYLVNSTEVFILDSNSSVDSGFFQAQTGGPFTSTSPNGMYAFGTINPEYTGTSVNAGTAVFSSPNINVTEDDNSNGSQTVGGTQSFTYAVNSNGLLQIPTSGASCTVSATSTTCQTLLYLISPTKAVVMDTQSGSPKTQVADQ